MERDHNDTAALLKVQGEVAASSLVHDEGAPSMDALEKLALGLFSAINDSVPPKDVYVSWTIKLPFWDCCGIRCWNAFYF